MHLTRIVEFAGPPSVGKSTLYKAVTRRSAFSWFGRRSGLHGWLYGSDLRHRLLRLGLGEPSFSSTHDNLMQRKLAELAHAQAPAYRRCWMLSIAAQKLLVDARLLSDHDENRYPLEEGLCHSFSAVLDDDAAIALMAHHGASSSSSPTKSPRYWSGSRHAEGVSPFIGTWMTSPCSG